MARFVAPKKFKARSAVGKRAKMLREEGLLLGDLIRYVGITARLDIPNEVRDFMKAFGDRRMTPILKAGLRAASVPYKRTLKALTPIGNQPALDPRGAARPRLRASIISKRPKKRRRGNGVYMVVGADNDAYHQHFYELGTYRANITNANNPNGYRFKRPNAKGPRTVTVKKAKVMSDGKRFYGVKQERPRGLSGPHWAKPHPWTAPAARISSSLMRQKFYASFRKGIKKLANDTRVRGKIVIR